MGTDAANDQEIYHETDETLVILAGSIRFYWEEGERLCQPGDLIELPADGFEDEGVLGVGKGLALGAGSLVSNTVEGAFGSVESITGAIG